LGLSHWDPYAMHRGGCLELYYCNMVEWSWWDSSLIWKTNPFPSVLWHCWFGHMTCKIVPEMTYNVSSGTLSLYTTTTTECIMMWMWLVENEQGVWPGCTGPRSQIAKAWCHSLLDAIEAMRDGSQKSLSITTELTEARYADILSCLVA